jgi:hypothetical protein
MHIEWEPQSPGWLGHGAEHDYLIVEQGIHGVAVLGRWKRPEPGSQGTLASVVADALSTVVTAGDPEHGKAIAEAFESGTLATTPLGWVRPPRHAPREYQPGETPGHHRQQARAYKFPDGPLSS